MKYAGTVVEHQRLYDSKAILSLHIFGHTAEQHKLMVHSGVKCALRAHFDWKTASGWSVVEDVGWSLEPGGCSFINQVGTVNENTDISLPTLSKIILYCFYVRSSRTCRSPTSATCFVLYLKGSAAYMSYLEGS